MTPRYIHLIWLLLIGLFACESDNAVESVQAKAGHPLVGSWQYVEQGYSPGSGYIVEKIPATPAQTITFSAQYTVSTANLSNSTWANARTYRIDSTANQRTELVLLDEKQQAIGPPMGIGLKNDSLRLTPPCIEGCHLLFIRLGTR